MYPPRPEEMIVIGTNNQGVMGKSPSPGHAATTTSYTKQAKQIAFNNHSFQNVMNPVDMRPTILAALATNTNTLTTESFDVYYCRCVGF